MKNVIGTIALIAVCLFLGLVAGCNTASVNPDATAENTKKVQDDTQAKIANDPNIPPQAKQAIMAGIDRGRTQGQGAAQGGSTEKAAGASKTAPAAGTAGATKPK